MPEYFIWILGKCFVTLRDYTAVIIRAHARKEL